MNKKRIIVSNRDFAKLKELISRSPGASENEYKELNSELHNAVVVESAKIPSDVITMNSKIRFKDIEESEDYIYSLVYPEDANTSQGKLSIIAPIGTALLGNSVGDKIDWKVPAGTKTFVVEEVIYQPEASGNFSI